MQGFKKLSDKSYHEIKGRLSQSSMKAYLQLMNLSRWKHEQDNRSEPNEAMILGSIVHQMVAEKNPDSHAGYVASPVGLRKDKRIKEYSDFLLNNMGSTIVDIETISEAKMMAEAVLIHPTARKIIDACDLELAAFWDIEGIPMKAKFDGLSRDKRYVFDLKTCKSANAMDFSKDVANYYAIQCATYINAVQSIEQTNDPIDFLFICVEKSPPYSVKVWQVPNELIDHGRRELTRAIQDLGPAILEDFYPSYSEDIEMLEAPRWLK